MKTAVDPGFPIPSLMDSSDGERVDSGQASVSPVHLFNGLTEDRCFSQGAGWGSLTFTHAGHTMPCSGLRDTFEHLGVCVGFLASSVVQPPFKAELCIP